LISALVWAFAGLFYWPVRQCDPVAARFHFYGMEPISNKSFGPPGVGV